LSLRTLEAALAAFFEVVFSGALVWDKALSAEVFDLERVFSLFEVFDALLAATFSVILDLDIFASDQSKTLKRTSFYATPGLQCRKSEV